MYSHITSKLWVLSAKFAARQPPAPKIWSHRFYKNLWTPAVFLRVMPQPQIFYTHTGQILPHTVCADLAQCGRKMCPNCPCTVVVPTILSAISDPL